MKAKMVVLVVVLLLVAMVPALVSGAGQAKPERTIPIKLDLRQPVGPQLDAQLGVGSKGPRSISAVVSRPARGAAALAPKPNAVYSLLNDSFETGAPAWNYWELGGSSVGWDPTTLDSKRGQYSLYSAAYNNDEFAYPYYDNDMFSWAYTDMDLQGARRVQVRFQFKNDSELDWDFFCWGGSADGSNYYGYCHTGSTNGKWRLVQMDSRNDPNAAVMLDSPFASFAYIFASDSFCCVDTGAFVDVVRIRAWGPVAQQLATSEQSGM